MHETFYCLTFKFYKVVRQQNSGAVEDFILPYSAVYLQMQKWKNYGNRSKFGKVIVKIKVAPFLMAHGVECHSVKETKTFNLISLHFYIDSRDLPPAEIISKHPLHTADGIREDVLAACSMFKAIYTAVLAFIRLSCVLWLKWKCVLCMYRRTSRVAIGALAPWVGQSRYFRANTQQPKNEKNAFIKRKKEIVPVQRNEVPEIRDF